MSKRNSSASPRRLSLTLANLPAPLSTQSFSSACLPAVLGTPFRPTALEEAGTMRGRTLDTEVPGRGVGICAARFRFRTASDVAGRVGWVALEVRDIDGVFDVCKGRLGRREAVVTFMPELRSGCPNVFVCGFRGPKISSSSNI